MALLSMPGSVLDTYYLSDANPQRLSSHATCSKPGIAVHNRYYHTATGNHMRYEITQCYLPPGRGDFPAFTPAEAGTRFSDPGRMQG